MFTLENIRKIDNRATRFVILFEAENRNLVRLLAERLRFHKEKITTYELESRTRTLILGISLIGRCPREC
jgi:cell fate regulator YaaT (PSP1 superfamily)